MLGVVEGVEGKRKLEEDDCKDIGCQVRDCDFQIETFSWLPWSSREVARAGGVTFDERKYDRYCTHLFWKLHFGHVFRGDARFLPIIIMSCTHEHTAIAGATAANFLLS